jgi:hypothetical protein
MWKRKHGGMWVGQLGRQVDVVREWRVRRGRDAGWERSGERMSGPSMG